MRAPVVQQGDAKVSARPRSKKGFKGFGVYRVSGLGFTWIRVQGLGSTWIRLKRIPGFGFRV